MKSQVDRLLYVTEGLLLGDASQAFPALRGGFTKDLSRLALYCQTRGLVVFLQDLPCLDALLIQGLETGRLNLEGHLTHKVSNKIKVPRLFSGLWLRVFDKSACLKQDADVNAILFLRQLCCLGKKLAVESSVSRRIATVENYHDIERHLINPTLAWESDEMCVLDREIALGDIIDQSGHPEGDLFDHVSGSLGLGRLLNQVQQVADMISESIGLYEPDFESSNLERQSMGTGFKHGPGAVAERFGRKHKSLFPNWPAKLQRRFPFELIGSTMTSMEERPINHEPPSRLICVPKTFKGPRLIASEPIAHQYCQQGTRRFLVDQLRATFGSYFVDFHDQGKSGDLVIAASRNRKLATVDLSDASDRLSCWVVERIFRRNFSLLSALHSHRTRWMRDDISRPPRFFSLKKFASQGTAVTFPVQTIVFLCIAIGVSLDGDITWDKIWALRDQVRVFGDDIIIPRHGFARLCLVMDALGLKVNRAKSFVNGFFRESCGTDGYKGYVVTPIRPTSFVADGPQSSQSMIDSVNNLHEAGYWHASHRLASLLPKSVIRYLRIRDVRTCGLSGLSSFTGTDESHLYHRWNKQYQRYEVKVWQIRPYLVKQRRQGYATLLDFFSRPYTNSSPLDGRPRIVSEVAHNLRVKHGPRWETSSSPDYGMDRTPTPLGVGNPASAVS